MLPLWLASLIITSGRRPAIATLSFASFWTFSAVVWGQIIPRMSGWQELSSLLVWLTMLLVVWKIAAPSIALLRQRIWVVAGLTLGFGIVCVALGVLPIGPLIQVLGWGHDNSAHVLLIDSNVLCGGFLFVCGSALKNVPSYLVEYPQGFSVTWASLTGAFADRDLNAALRIYASVYLLSSLALIAATAWLAIALALGSRWRWAAAVMSTITIAFGVWSHQFWSGFASFIWAALIILAFVVMREASLLVIGRLWIILAGSSLIAVYYSHQLLIPFLAIYIFVDTLVNRQQIAATARRSPGIVMSMTFAGTGLALLAPRTAQGNSFIDQVLVQAGMESVPTWVWIPLSVAGGLVLFARVHRDRAALRWATLSSGALFGALALFTLRVNGYVSYYPMKLLTFLVLILIAASAAIVVAKPINTRAHQAWFTFSGLAVLTLAILPPLLRYPGFKTAYQGSTPTVLRTLLHDVYGGGVALCAPFVLRAVDKLPPAIERVEVYRNGELQPLEGRWINSIRGHWDTTAWKNEVDWRPMEAIPRDQLPDMIISHDSVGRTPNGIPRVNFGEPCDRRQLPPVLPIG